MNLDPDNLGEGYWPSKKKANSNRLYSIANFNIRNSTSLSARGLEITYTCSQESDTSQVMNRNNSRNTIRYADDPSSNPSGLQLKFPTISDLKIATLSTRDRIHIQQTNRE